ncbi:MAG: hypothetical protein KGV59_06270 [Tenacibaculum sp.]|nr:hypothetical protein [Tenacibaculum sp.]
MEFKKLKEIYINICKDNDACISETKRVLKSENKKELLQFVKDNAIWCRSYNAITIELLDAFGEDLCNELGIYYKGVKDKIKNQKDLLFLGNFKCKILDNSTVTEMLDNSTVTKMLGNSTVTKMWDNSTVTEMWDNSTVKIYGKPERVKKQKDCSQIIDFRNKKIYVVKSKFEIMEV